MPMNKDSYIHVLKLLCIHANVETWLRHILCRSTGSDPDYRNMRDSVLTALLEYFNLLTHALIVHSCYLSSYHLAS